MNYIQLDYGTKSEIRRIYRQDGLTTEEIAERFGIPESLVCKVILWKV